MNEFRKVLDSEYYSYLFRKGVHIHTGVDDIEGASDALRSLLHRNGGV